MTQDPCHELRLEVEAAKTEWERILSAGEHDEPKSHKIGTAMMGGDLGSRFNEAISQHEAASRRYRTAVRSLAECLRQHQNRPGTLGSTHE